MTFVWKALAIMALMFALDFIWAKYTQAINNNRITLAVVSSALIYLVGGLATISYVADPWLLIPAVVGAMAGTYAAMKWEKKERW